MNLRILCGKFTQGNGKIHMLKDTVESKTSNTVASTLAQWIEENQDKEDIKYRVDALWEIVEGSTAKDKELQ
jgi:hypothetical protein